MNEFFDSRASEICISLHIQKRCTFIDFPDGSIFGDCVSCRILGTLNLYYSEISCPKIFHSGSVRRQLNGREIKDLLKFWASLCCEASAFHLLELHPQARTVKPLVQNDAPDMAVLLISQQRLKFSSPNLLTTKERDLDISEKFSPATASLPSKQT